MTAIVLVVAANKIDLEFDYPNILSGRNVKCPAGATGAEIVTGSPLVDRVLKWGKHAAKIATLRGGQ